MCSKATAVQLQPNPVTKPTLFRKWADYFHTNCITTSKQDTSTVKTGKHTVPLRLPSSCLTSQEGNYPIPQISHQFHIIRSVTSRGRLKQDVWLTVTLYPNQIKFPPIPHHTFSHFQETAERLTHLLAHIYLHVHLIRYMCEGGGGGGGGGGGYS